MFRLFKTKMKRVINVPGATIFNHSKNAPSDDLVIAQMIKLGASAVTISQTEPYKNKLQNMRDQIEKQEKPCSEESPEDIWKFLDSLIVEVIMPDSSNLSFEETKEMKSEISRYFGEKIAPNLAREYVVIKIDDLEIFEIGYLKEIYKDAATVAEKIAKKEIKKYS